MTTKQVKLSTTQADVMRRIGAGSAVLYECINHYWFMPDSRTRNDRQIRALLSRGMLASAGPFNGRRAVLTPAGRAWLDANPPTAPDAGAATGATGTGGAS